MVTQVIQIIKRVVNFTYFRIDANQLYAFKAKIF